MFPGKLTRTIALALWLSLLFACTPSGNADWVTVKYVNDGDTILLSDGRRVRYIGIDTPEIDHENNRAEAFGYQAREVNRKLVTPDTIRLEVDREPQDRYGRTLAYVYLSDGTLVNTEMLRAGLAVVFYKRPNTRLFSKMLAVQREAMVAGRGLWKTARADRTAVVGNRNSMRFHLPSCPAVRQMRPKNRVAFKKKWDAFWDGYSPARDCIPRVYE